jgi:hypothetical protein
MGWCGFLMNVAPKDLFLMEKGTLSMDDIENAILQYEFDFDIEDKSKEIEIDFSLVKECWDIYDEMSLERMDYESY